MVLTGKALEDFRDYLYNKYDVLYKYEDYHTTMLYAEIIEWFDSLEYKENNTLWNHCFSICYWYRGMKEYKEATKQAIIKANEIYNEQEK